jgi:hypothetical protein
LLRKAGHVAKSSAFASLASVIGLKVPKVGTTLPTLLPLYLGCSHSLLRLSMLSSLRSLAMSTLDKPKVLFVLGGPGAGKGTVCKNIIEKHGFVHLSAGDLLREERANPGSQYGELIESHISNGTIVPVEITCSLLDRAMQTSKSPHNKFLIDGFPRNQDNLQGWNKVPQLPSYPLSYRRSFRPCHPSHDLLSLPPSNPIYPSWLYFALIP